MRPADVVRYFDARLAEHGEGAKAVDWGSEASQRARFAALAGIAPLEGCRVLDVGCGLGAFGAYLSGISGLMYEGCDLNPRMIETARRSHPAAKLFVCDIADETAPLEPLYDYVFASGIFFLQNEAFLHRVVARMFSLCRRGVAFNTLSSWAEKRDAGEYYADPARLLRFCRTLTGRVALRHEYLPNDATFYLYRDGR